MQRKSTYSAYNGNRVEVPGTWRTATYSISNGACVEVSGCSGEAIKIRDTKNRGNVVLAFQPAAWKAFTSSL
jgi:Domain of unknown function (DUF397)